MNKTNFFVKKSRSTVDIAFYREIIHDTMKFELILRDEDFTKEELELLKTQAMREGLSLKAFITKLAISKMNQINKPKKKAREGAAA